MARAYEFDHLAIAVERWRDGFPRLVGEFGGRWTYGGDNSNGFAAAVLSYAHDMRLELIAPSSAHSFMRRFLDRSGPGPHHITFTVPSLDAMLGEMSERGISAFRGRTDRPLWQEAFVHPKQVGLGTLLQVAQDDEPPTPGPTPQPLSPEFPQAQGEPAEIAWIGLSVESVAAAGQLLTDVLRGEWVADGRGWARIGWSKGHDLVIRDGAATPGGPDLWPAGHLGVAHVMFAPAGLDLGALERREVRAQRRPDDPLTGLTAWVTG